MKKIIALVVFALFAVSVAFSGKVESARAKNFSPYQVSGAVRMVSAPVKGVVILVYNKNSQLVAQDVTDINGQYSVELENGNYKLVPMSFSSAYIFDPKFINTVVRNSDIGGLDFSVTTLSR